MGDINGAWAKKPFQVGTVFNVEPLIEFREKKIHMRLEDTVISTESGAENLTAAVPAELDPLYVLIKQKGINSASFAERMARK